MKKPKKRSSKVSKRRQFQAQRPSQQPYHAAPKSKPQRTIWERIRDHPVVWVIGLVAALVGLAEGAYDALHDPEIIPDVTVSESSYAQPFEIENAARYFSMHDAKFRCFWNDVIFREDVPRPKLYKFVFSGSPWQDETEFEPTASTDIKPGDHRHLICDVAKVDRIWNNVGAGRQYLPLAGVKLKIRAEYKTRIFFWLVPRTFMSEQFEWQQTAAGPRWVTGSQVQFNR